MPSTTLPSSEEKNLVRRAVPTSKIFTAAVARLFVAYPNPHSWTYSNIWGAAVFLKDKSRSDSFFIRIVDLENHGGVIWEQELYEGFQYTQERPFFHTFDTDECQAGLLFVDDSEAETFYNKIINRQTLASKAPPIATSVKAPRPSVIGGSRTKKVKGKVDKNSIGLPSEFRHLGHIGYTPEQGFSVQNNSPEWNGIFEQLKALGISADEINSNQDFIKDFVEQRGGPPASTPARPVGHTSTPPLPNAKKSPGGGGGRRPPPPPPPRRSARPSGNTSAPPPPPAPPSLPSRNPPLPNRSNASPALPSRPPAGGAPPPPPPPPGMGGPPPPPPAPSGSPGIANTVPAEVLGGGRSDLMASIRGAGGIGTLRKTEGPREPSPLAGAGYEAGGAAGAAAGAAGGGDLASSLAVALKQRANAMQSDDEEEEDNDDWED